MSLCQLFLQVMQNFLKLPNSIIINETKLRSQAESAYDCIAELGEVGAAQFRDVR